MSGVVVVVGGGGSCSRTRAMGCWISREHGPKSSLPCVACYIGTRVGPLMQSFMSAPNENKYTSARA